MGYVKVPSRQPWLLRGGLWMALFYATLACYLVVLIIIAPIGFRVWMAGYCVNPDRYVVVHRKSPHRIAAVIGHIVWFFCGGLVAVIGHLALALLNAVLPGGEGFKSHHAGLAGIALRPFANEVLRIDQVNRSTVRPGQ